MQCSQRSSAWNGSYVSPFDTHYVEQLYQNAILCNMNNCGLASGPGRMNAQLPIPCGIGDEPCTRRTPMDILLSYSDVKEMLTGSPCAHSMQKLNVQSRHRELHTVAQEPIGITSRALIPPQSLPPQPSLQQKLASWQLLKSYPLPEEVCQSFDAESATQPQIDPQNSNQSQPVQEPYLSHTPRSEQNMHVQSTQQMIHQQPSLQGASLQCFPQHPFQQPTIFRVHAFANAIPGYYIPHPQCLPRCVPHQDMHGSEASVPAPCTHPQSGQQHSAYQCSVQQHPTHQLPFRMITQPIVQPSTALQAFQTQPYSQEQPIAERHIPMQPGQQQVTQLPFFRHAHPPESSVRSHSEPQLQHPPPPGPTQLMSSHSSHQRWVPPNFGPLPPPSSNQPFRSAEMHYIAPQPAQPSTRPPMPGSHPCHAGRSWHYDPTGQGAFSAFASRSDCRGPFGHAALTYRPLPVFPAPPHFMVPRKMDSGVHSAAASCRTSHMLKPVARLHKAPVPTKGPKPTAGAVLAAVERCDFGPAAIADALRELVRWTASHDTATQAMGVDEWLRACSPGTRRICRAAKGHGIAIKCGRVAGGVDWALKAAGCCGLSAQAAVRPCGLQELLMYPRHNRSGQGAAAAGTCDAYGRLLASTDTELRELVRQARKQVCSPEQLRSDQARVGAGAAAAGACRGSCVKPGKAAGRDAQIPSKKGPKAPSAREMEAKRQIGLALSRLSLSHAAGAAAERDCSKVADKTQPQVSFVTST